jgi:uncharacterized protein
MGFHAKVPGRAALLAVSMLALAAPTPAASHAKRWTAYDRPATYTVEHEANLAIPMRDGVVLRANLDLPDAPGPFPTLIVQTPYNKDGLVNSALGGGFRYFAERGYAVLTVDVRGTGSSGGEWDSFGEAEQADGPEVVEWAAAQPWSTGEVGLMGPSYMGLNQLLTAARRPPHLKAIFPVVPMADSYRDIVFSGGQVNISFIPLWLGLVTASSLTPAPGADDPLSSLTALLSHISGTLDFVPSTLLSAATGGDLAYDGAFWKLRSPLEVVDRINVPAFVVGGLHDLFQRGEPLIYERLKRQVPARLLMGPWDHLGGSTGAGLPRDGLPSLAQIELRWFDHWLMGLDTRTGRIPRVTQYVYGKERYRTQADWPDPRLSPRRWYLSGNQRFEQNPLAGICTQSTAQWTAGLGAAIPCVNDGADHEFGAAKYMTEPLKRRLDISGPILADLWVTTTASDAVVAVRVKDIAPNGEVTELTSGWLAGSMRAVDPSRSRYVESRRGGAKGSRVLLQPWHPFTRASLLPVHPGEPVELPVEIFPTRATILPGHRLQVTVSGGDFPHQLPPLPQLAGSLAGRVEVLTGPGHRSYVELPALRRHCREGCRPLPVPNLIRGD